MDTLRAGADSLVSPLWRQAEISLWLASFAVYQPDAASAEKETEAEDEASAQPTQLALRSNLSNKHLLSAALTVSFRPGEEGAGVAR